MCQFFLDCQFSVGHEPLRVQRLDEEVADQSHHQHAHQDVHGLVVNLLAGNTQTQLVLTHVVNDHRTQHTRCSPGGQQAAVNGAHHLRAEQVSKIRGNSCKAAAVHAQNHAESAHEKNDAARCCAARNAEIHQAAQHKEDDVCQFSAQFVGQAGPEKPATDVEKAEQRCKAGCGSRNRSQLRLVKFTELFSHANQ